MELKEKIHKQATAGFSSAEIYNSLLADGHDKEEIDKEMKAEAAEIKKNNSVSPGSIFLGILMVLVIMFRIFRYSNSNGTAATLAFISIFTGIGLAIFFLRKEDSVKAKL